MTYDEAMEFIAAAYKFGSKLGLSRISALLRHMGNPQDKLKFVHVAGTNGKGSTTSFIGNILMDAGYNVGSYISPFIHCFNERIAVNGKQISNDDIARIVGEIKEYVELMAQNDEGYPTEFEVVTALGFQYFYEQGCDAVVLEVGLGGRLDSTNVIKNPLACTITTIDYDHMSILGDTLEEIAAEKAGIIKENSSVVLYPQQESVAAVFERACREKSAELYKVDSSAIEITDYNIDGQKFNFGKYTGLELGFLCEFQTLNAATAVLTIEVLQNKGFNITEENIRRGLKNTRWPGRFEICSRNPLVIVDGAHNVQGAEHLAINLKKYFGGKEITFIVGVFADKDYRAIVSKLAPLATRFIATSLNSPRGLPPQDLADYLRTVCDEVRVTQSPSEAAELGALLCGDGVLCSFGSLYYVGEIRKYFTSAQ